MAVSLPRQNYDLMNRESNGRTVFEYDACVTSAKSDTLKRSLDKDELSNEALGMNCKDKNESDYEPDGEPAAKMRRGGGRRKQSKPMRMFAELDTVGDLDPSRPVSDNLPAESDYGKGGGTLAGTPDCATVPSTSTFVCELCHENFQTGSALKEHFDQVHTMVLGEEPVRDNACPTKYHLLGKELIQDTGDFEPSGKLGTKEMGGTVPEKRVCRGTPTPSDDNSGTRCDWASISKDEDLVVSAGESAKPIDRSHHAIGKAPSSDQLQVKFLSGCDESKPATSVSFGSMMDKPLEGCIGKQEFGASAPAFEVGVVQSEPHSQAATSTSWDANKSRIFHPDAYCEICDREFCNKYFLKTHKANKHGIYDNNMTGLEASTSSNNELFFSMLQTQPPSTTPPKSSPPKQPGDLGSMGGGGSSANLPLLSGVSNMVEDSGSVTPGKSTPSDSDECCDICQKHFFSKNQLKRHKQETHGGFPQLSDGGGKRSGIAGVSSPSSMLLNASMENPISSHPLLLPHLSSSTNSVPAALSDFSRMANLSNLMFLNPFNPPLAVIPPLFQTPGLGFRPNSLAMPQLPLQDVQKAGNSSRFPNDSSALPNSLLQSMGVLNAETLMELYRKEFCNNYLMRSQEASGRGGLFSGSMTGFQSGLSNSLTGNITFPMPGKTSSQDLVMNNEPLLMKKEKHDLSLDSNSELCEICKKTFANKSLLLSHLATTHNIKQESCDLASELMKLDKLNEEHHFEKAMFGNMVAAKLVDRVQCDICNKEVCNKYFLKTHKIKVHGWDPVSGERDMLEKPAAKQASPMHTQNIAPEPPMPDMLNVEKPKEEELLQMGIDPEAYCEICKKEFCNKYFLKTHKQNIHGIKTTTNPLDNRTNPVEAWNFPPVPSQPSSLTAAQLSLLASSQQLQSFAPTLNAPPPLMSVLDSGMHDSSSEKRSWKWKEPVNAMRVTCEICNKVLCNKYFLKTHMMKRHGVNYDTITGQLTSANVKGLSEYGPLLPRDETHPQDNFPSSLHHTASQSTMEKQFQSSRTVVRHTGMADESQSMGEGGYGNEDDSSSAGGRITDRHDSSTRSSGNEGEGGRVATAVNLVVSEATKALDLTSAATTVMAKTWHVPSDDHDIEDRQMNNDSLSCDATQQMTSGFEGALPSRGVDDGDLLPGEGTEALKIHLMKDVNLDEAHGSSEASSPLSSSFEESRNHHHQSTIQSSPALGKFEGVPVETAKTAIANHIRSQQKKRLFRCTHCRERFQQRSQCEAHIRSAHPRMEGSGIPGHHVDGGSERTSRKQSSSSSSTNEPSSASTNPLGYLNGYASAKQPNFSSESSSAERKDSAVGSADVLSKQQPVIYAQPIDQTNLSNILMQPFLLKEVGGDNHFAASLVYLPALQKINEPVSVTFSLTPILQH